MNNMEVEILLVEDNVYDAEMTVRALKKVNLASTMSPGILLDETAFAR